MLPCVELAKKRGVTLQVEPINSAETTMIHSTYDGLAFLKELGDPENVGILYDTYHSNLEDGDMLAAIRAAAGRITNVHLADSHRGLPGYGTIDFKAVYREIQATRYKGAYALETLSIPSPEFVNAHCYECVRTIME
jgi:sugar phosphate isomerase/epimerase